MKSNLRILLKNHIVRKDKRVRPPWRKNLHTPREKHIKTIFYFPYLPNSFVPLLYSSLIIHHRKLHQSEFQILQAPPTRILFIIIRCYQQFIGTTLQ